MSKPTYEELEKRVKDLERTETKRKKAEEELKESEEKYRSLADSIGDMFFSLDKNLKYTFRNKKANDFCGLSTEDAIGKSPYDIFSDTESTDNMMDFYREVLETKQSNNVVNHFMKDGEKCFIDFRVYPSKKGISVIAKDITERKKYEEALKKSEAKFRNLYNTSPTGYHSIDVNGYILDMNKTELVWLGYKKKEMIGKKTIFDLQTEESAKRGKEFFKQLKNKGRVKNIELEMKRKDGTSFPVILNALVLRDENGKFIMTNTTVIDITERKKAEEELQKYQEELKTIVDSAPVQIWYKDKENRIIRVNQAGADALGKRIENIEDKLVKDIFPAADSDHYYEDDIEVVNSGKPKLNIIEEMQTALGERRWVSTDKVPFRDEKGNIGGVIAFIRDITELKKAEEERLYLSKLEGIYNLVVTVNHEMNQPLSVITSYCEHLLEELEKGSQEYEDAQIINDEARKLAELVKRIAELKKAEEITFTEYSKGVGMIDLRDTNEGKNE